MRLGDEQRRMLSILAYFMLHPYESPFRIDLKLGLLGIGLLSILIGTVTLVVMRFVRHAGLLAWRERHRPRPATADDSPRGIGH